MDMILLTAHLGLSTAVLMLQGRTDGKSKALAKILKAADAGITDYIKNWKG